MEQLQVLLKLSENRGFFSAAAVARAFNCALLSALTSDPQIIARSVRDPTLLENCILPKPSIFMQDTFIFIFIFDREQDIYWAAFLEQNLFPATQAKSTKSVAATTPTTSDDPFLPPIFRSESGAWIDFQFSQKLLEFFDQITIGNPPPRASQTNLLPLTGSYVTFSTLIRMLLRLTLVMLYETDSVLHTERVSKKQTYLKQVEESVTANFGNAAGTILYTSVYVYINIFIMQLAVLAQWRNTHKVG
jgi:hypothetical protein